jgi:ABC-type antimicrobial peptide transport system permease subunit
MPSNNEILISLTDAAKLAGISSDTVLTIRVKTSDNEKLIDFLKEEQYSVVVGSGGSNPIVINENKSYEQTVAESLAIKYAEPDEFKTTNESFVSTFIQEGTNTIGAVIIGFIGLNATLTFIGITAILSRGVIERRKDIGILSAIGADKKTIYLLLLKDLLIISIIASGVGVALGFTCAQIVQNFDLVVAFGHVITPDINLTLFLLTFIIAIVIGCASGLFVSAVTLSAEPSQLINEIEDTTNDFEAESLPEAVGV